MSILHLTKQITKTLCSLLFISSFTLCAASTPFPPIQDWMLQQIREDLQCFTEQGITQESLDTLMKNHGEEFRLIRVKISGQKISTETASPIQNNSDIFRRDCMVKAFQEIANLVSLPDIDFVFSWEDSLDGASAVIDAEAIGAPIFVFAKNTDSSPRLGLIPDFEAVVNNKSLMTNIFKGNALYPWEKKKNQALWRGSMTGGMFTPNNFLSFPRSKSVTASLKYPELVDSRFVGFTQCSETDQKAIEALYNDYYGSFISVTKQIEYKYQLLIDGNSCAYSRSFWQLLANCVILKQESKAIQWYYRCLKPYENYIPIAEDLSNLKDTIEWCIIHDKEAKEISKRAQNFARKNLCHKQILQYIYLLMTEYAKLQK